jgi:hypothetical protein
VVNADKPATTQPSAPAVAQAKPTTQPSTPAVAGTSKPATTPAVADTDDEETPSSDVSAKAEEKKATNPGAAPTVTVTELPVEEVKPDAPTADDNK